MSEGPARKLPLGAGGLGAILIVVIVLIAVLFGLDLLAPDDSGSTTEPAATSPSATSTPGDPSTASPDADPSAGTASEAAPQRVLFDGRVDRAGGEPVHDATRNEILILLRDSGLAMELRLHLNGVIDIQTQEKACFSFELDPSRPFPVTSTEGDRLVVEATVTLRAGYAEGRCTGSDQGETAPREAALRVVLDGAGLARGTLKLPTGVLEFSAAARPV